MTSPDGSNLPPVIASEGVPHGQIYFMQPGSPLPTSLPDVPTYSFGPIIDEATNLGSISGAPWVISNVDRRRTHPENRNPETAVLDEIDALVDQQMASYGQRSGYDRNVNQSRCPHCPESWHGLKITRRMQEMRRAFSELTHYYEDEATSDDRSRSLAQIVDGYNHAEDDSETLCPGSNYEGEWTPPSPPRASASVTFNSLPHERVNAFFRAAYAQFERLGFSGALPDDPLTPLARPEPRWWRCEDAALLRSGRIGTEYRRDRGHSLTVDGERVELTRDERDEVLVRHARTPGDSCDLIALDIHCVAPPTVGNWVLRESADPPQTPQQRALPRPSTTPPIWAVEETQRRRRR